MIFHKDPPDFIDWFWSQINLLSAILLGVIFVMFFVLGMCLIQVRAMRVICGL